MNYSQYPLPKKINLAQSNVKKYFLTPCILLSPSNPKNIIPTLTYIVEGLLIENEHKIGPLDRITIV